MIAIISYFRRYTIRDFEIIRRVRKLGVSYSIIQEPAMVSSRKYECNFISGQT